MGQKKKLLIVDDEKEACAALLSCFQERYEVRIAYDGQMALAVIRAFEPDCILLDIRMPALNGRDVLNTLKREGAKGRVIVITGSLNPDFLAEYKALGAFAALMKPIDLEVLEAVVESAMSA